MKLNDEKNNKDTATKVDKLYQIQDEERQALT